MKNLIRVLPLLVLLSCDNAANSVHGIMGTREETVYVCTGHMSQCYHKTRHCKGLERCSKTIEAVSMAEAIKWGRRPCGYCY